MRPLITQAKLNKLDKSLPNDHIYSDIYLQLVTIQLFTRIRSTDETKVSNNNQEYVEVEITHMALSGKKKCDQSTTII